MSFEKLKSDSFFVRGKQRSITIKIVGDITSKDSKVIIDFCSVCNRKKSMTVSDSIKQAEKQAGRFSAKAGENSATNVLKSPGRGLEITSNIATAAATKNPKAVLSSLPAVIIFYHTGKGLYRPRFK